MFENRQLFIDDLNKFISSCKSKINHVLEELDWTRESIYSACEKSSSAACNELTNFEPDVTQRTDLPDESCKQAGTSSKEGVSNMSVGSDGLYMELVESLNKQAGSKDDGKSKEEVLLEMLKMERDAKRRRINYKNRVHTKHKSHIEIMREVLAEQMATLTHNLDDNNSISAKVDNQKNSEPSEDLIETDIPRCNPYLAWKTILETAKRPDSNSEQIEGYGRKEIINGGKRQRDKPSHDDHQNDYYDRKRDPERPQFSRNSYSKYNDLENSKQTRDSNYKSGRGERNSKYYSSTHDRDRYKSKHYDSSPHHKTYYSRNDTSVYIENQSTSSIYRSDRRRKNREKSTSVSTDSTSESESDESVGYRNDRYGRSKHYDKNKYIDSLKEKEESYYVEHRSKRHSHDYDVTSDNTNKRNYESKHYDKDNYNNSLKRKEDSYYVEHKSKRHTYDSDDTHSSKSKHHKSYSVEYDMAQENKDLLKRKTYTTDDKHSGSKSKKRRHSRSPSSSRSKYHKSSKHKSKNETR